MPRLIGAIASAEQMLREVRDGVRPYWVVPRELVGKLVPSLFFDFGLIQPSDVGRRVYCVPDNTGRSKTSVYQFDNKRKLL